MWAVTAWAAPSRPASEVRSLSHTCEFYTRTHCRCSLVLCFTTCPMYEQKRKSVEAPHWWHVREPTRKIVLILRSLNTMTALYNPRPSISVVYVSLQTCISIKYAREEKYVCVFIRIHRLHTHTRRTIKSMCVRKSYNREKLGANDFTVLIVLGIGSQWCGSE